MDINMTYVWIAMIVLLLILEAITVQLTTIWFAGGGLVALIAHFIYPNTSLEIGLFLITSFVLLIFTRPIAMKYLMSKKVATNYEEYIGKIVTITQDVNNRKGTGKGIINGMEWTVRTKDANVCVKENDLAKIVGISGVKLMIEPIENKEME